MTTNEAAERLLAYVEDQLQPQFKSPDAYAGWRKAAIGFFAARLAAERRATVERIGPVLTQCMDLLEWYGRKAADNWYLNDEVQEAITKGRAILDEEAAR